jgi:hypothetical protein
MTWVRIIIIIIMNSTESATCLRSGGKHKQKVGIGERPTTTMPAAPNSEQQVYHRRPHPAPRDPAAEGERGVGHAGTRAGDLHLTEYRWAELHYMKTRSLRKDSIISPTTRPRCPQGGDMGAHADEIPAAFNHIFHFYKYFPCFLKILKKLNLSQMLQKQCRTDVFEILILL